MRFGHVHLLAVVATIAIAVGCDSREQPTAPTVVEGPVAFKHTVIDPRRTLLPVVKGLIDVNGDGTLQPVIGYNGGSGGLYWYSMPANGPLAPQLWAKHAITPTGFFYEDIQTYDVNGDGAPDLITTHDGKMWWYENPRGYGGDPTQPWPEHLIGPGLGHDISLADLDRDGKIDVVTENAIYFQNNPTSWTMVRAPQYNRTDRGVATFDALRNGVQDIMGFLPTPPYQFAWFENPLNYGGNPPHRYLETPHHWRRQLQPRRRSLLRRR